MFLFAIDNIYRILLSEPGPAFSYFPPALNLGVQYFFLGISSIYIAQNFIMLFGFLPGKGTFFNSQYFRDIQELKNDHIKRFSDHQVYIGHSIICIITTGLLYWINFKFNYLPRHTAIWIGLIFFPLLLNLSNIRFKRRETSKYHS